MFLIYVQARSTVLVHILSFSYVICQVAIWEALGQVRVNVTEQMAHVCLRSELPDHIYWVRI